MVRGWNSTIDACGWQSARPKSTPVVISKSSTMGTHEIPSYLISRTFHRQASAATICSSIHSSMPCIYNAFSMPPLSLALPAPSSHYPRCCFEMRLPRPHHLGCLSPLSMFGMVPRPVSAAGFILRQKYRVAAHLCVPSFIYGSSSCQSRRVLGSVIAETALLTGRESVSCRNLLLPGSHRELPIPLQCVVFSDFSASTSSTPFSLMRCKSFITRSLIHAQHRRRDCFQLGPSVVLRLHDFHRQ